MTDIAGVRVGHWTDALARTGCTVVLLPEGTVASAEVRGGAPATRELDLLAPGRLVERIDAVVLTGGSAFGLSVADGVVAWLEERGLGFSTPAGPVPIVPALGLFDLAVGDAAVRPGAVEGRAACETASAGAVEVGLVGAGTGCTVGSWRGPDAVRPGGLGAATRQSGELVVTVIVAVNATGDIAPIGAEVPETPPPPSLDTEPFANTNTTIGVILTNARLDKAGCHLVAQSGHDGLARAIFPAHTRADGDALVAAATGEVDASVDRVRILATQAVEAAIRSVADGAKVPGEPRSD